MSHWWVISVIKSWIGTSLQIGISSRIPSKMQKTRGFIISVQQIHDYSRLSRWGIISINLKRNIEGGKWFCQKWAKYGFLSYLPNPLPSCQIISCRWSTKNSRNAINKIYSLSLERWNFKWTEVLCIHVNFLLEIPFLLSQAV